MGVPVSDFYSMTLNELDNAIEGYNKRVQDDLQWAMYNARLVCFYTFAPHLKKNSGVKKPEDLFPLALDKILRRQRLKRLEPIKVVYSDQ
jgi:hypothetical protein